MCLQAGRCDIAIPQIAIHHHRGVFTMSRHMLVEVGFLRNPLVYGAEARPMIRSADGGTLGLDHSMAVSYKPPSRCSSASMCNKQASRFHLHLLPVVH